MALNNRVGGTEERSFAREATTYSVSIDGDAATPTIIEQDEGVFSGVSRTSAGLYVLTSRSRFNRIIPLGAPNIQSTPAGEKWTARATVVDGLAATNTVTVEVTNEAGAAADPSERIDLGLRLIVSTGT